MATPRRSVHSSSQASPSQLQIFLSIIKVLGALLALAIVLTVCVMVVAAFWDSPPTGKKTDNVLFTIEKGETGISVARRLETAGLIRSQFFFRVIMSLEPGNSNLKTGMYRIEGSMGSMAILNLLKSGKEVLMRVLIPEGCTLRQIASVLESNEITVGTEFISACADSGKLRDLGIQADSAEGFLFPDTYLFAKHMEPEAVLRAFIANFREKLEKEIPESSFFTAQEILERITLASIVEREYRMSEEASLIAGVFNNRIKIGMKLQSCATVVYVMTEILNKKHPKQLLFTDLEIDNPFNTYLYYGLPPAPICSPGLHALKAAFHPTPSSYLYFRLINTSTGKHHFSETYDEHLGADPLLVKGIGS